jgi:hypothetical protein
MKILLYLRTASAKDRDEQDSIHRTVEDHVIQRLKCEADPVYIQNGSGQMTVVLTKNGSTKRSVYASTQKELERILRKWVRMTGFDILKTEEDWQKWQRKPLPMK